MYRGFNLKLEDELNDKDYYSIGVELFKILTKEIRPKLKGYILPDGILDGNKIMDDWFPEFNTHVFLSHSHLDRKKALAFAGALLVEFEIITFIDSTVWGYSNELLKMIDDEYCKNVVGENYNYDSRNYSTSHVHLMLSSALNRMIDNSEAIFFLNSSNSVSTRNITEKTNSAWIFSEINTSKIINKKTPNRLKKLTKAFSDTIMLSESKRSDLRIEYELELSHFTRLNENQFYRWLNTPSSSPENALDKLYMQNPINSKFLI